MKVLKLPIAPVSQVVFDEHDLLALVDTQPPVGNHSLPARYPVDVVIDHHPLRDESLGAPFADVGGDYGATSTMLVEYLRAAPLEPSIEVATALFYGIKADTRDLGRQTTPADVDAYLWLFPRMDKHLLGRIEHPDLPAEYFRLYHLAIERAKVYGPTVVTVPGRGVLAGHGGRGGRAAELPRGHEVVAGRWAPTAASSTSRCGCATGG